MTTPLGGMRAIIYQSYKYAGIANRQLTAIGIIASHEIHSHDSYSYRFKVAGRLYSGLEPALRGKRLNAGDEITTPKTRRRTALRASNTAL